MTPLSLALAAALAAGGSRAAEPEIRGAWHAETYILKDGTRHPVRGHIFFSEKDWTVLFFVMERNQPRRASAEGGTYTLEGNRLVFTHLYNLSTGKAMKGLEEGPLRLSVREGAGAPTEPCALSVEGGRLRIDFPSGNAMTFRR